MATLISNKTFFTEDFKQLSDSRKVEEIIQQLYKIVCKHDIDGSFTSNTIMEELDVLRKIVK